MANFNFMDWRFRTFTALLAAILIFIAVLSVSPIYGVNISPHSTGGSPVTGGSYGDLNSTHQGYSCGI